MGSVVGGLVAIGVLGLALWHYWRRRQAGEKDPVQAVQPASGSGDLKIQGRPIELSNTARLELDGVERTELPISTPELDGSEITRPGMSEQNMESRDSSSHNVNNTSTYTISS